MSLQYIQQLGPLISAVLGLLAIVSPATTEKFVSVKGEGKLGNAEIRATYGGFFLGIALYALTTQADAAFWALGFGWLSAAAVRFFTLFFGFYSPKNVGGVVFEASIGVLCLVGFGS